MTSLIFATTVLCHFCSRELATVGVVVADAELTAGGKLIAVDVVAAIVQVYN